jgi:hypothetical protein
MPPSSKTSVPQTLTPLNKFPQLEPQVEFLLLGKGLHFLGKWFLVIPLPSQLSLLQG